MQVEAENLAVAMVNVRDAYDGLVRQLEWAYPINGNPLVMDALQQLNRAILDANGAARECRDA